MSMVISLIIGLTLLKYSLRKQVIFKLMLALVFVESLVIAHGARVMDIGIIIGGFVSTIAITIILAFIDGLDF